MPAWSLFPSFAGTARSTGEGSLRLHGLGLGAGLQYAAPHSRSRALQQTATTAILAVKCKRALQEDAPLELHMWGTNLYTGELLTDLHWPCKQLVTFQGV